MRGGGGGGAEVGVPPLAQAAGGLVAPGHVVTITHVPLTRDSKVTSSRGILSWRTRLCTAPRAR